MGKTAEAIRVGMRIDRTETIDTKPVSYRRRTPSKEFGETVPKQSARTRDLHQWAGLDKTVEAFEKSVARRAPWVYGSSWAGAVALTVTGFVAWLLAVEKIVLFATERLEVWESWAWLILIHVGLIAVGALAAVSGCLWLGRSLILRHDRKVQFRRICLHNRLRAAWEKLDDGVDSINLGVLSLQGITDGPFAYLNTPTTETVPKHHWREKIREAGHRDNADLGQWGRFW